MKKAYEARFDAKLERARAKLLMRAQAMLMRAQANQARGVRASAMRAGRGSQTTATTGVRGEP